jgi:hypothetical protein
MSERQRAAWLQDPAGLDHGVVGTGEMQHAEVDDDGVGGLVGKRQRLGIADAKVDGGKQAARSLDHPIGEIDPGDLGAAHGSRRRQASRPTGHVEEALAASDAGGIQQALADLQRQRRPILVIGRHLRLPAGMLGGTKGLGLGH